jgi:hypothetical protein
VVVVLGTLEVYAAVVSQPVSLKAYSSEYGGRGAFGIGDTRVPKQGHAGFG